MARILLNKSQFQKGFWNQKSFSKNCGKLFWEENHYLLKERRRGREREREQGLSTVKQKDLPIIGQPIQSIITKTRWHGTIGGLVKYIWKLLLSRFLNSHRTRLCKYSVTQQKAATVPCSFNQETLSLRTPGHSVIHSNRIIKFLKKKTCDGK